MLSGLDIKCFRVPAKISQAFIIKDENGHTLATFGVASESAVSLSFMTLDMAPQKITIELD
jgi:hypothetical protein